MNQFLGPPDRQLRARPGRPARRRSPRPHFPAPGRALGLDAARPALAAFLASPWAPRPADRASAPAAPPGVSRTSPGKWGRRAPAAPGPAADRGSRRVLEGRRRPPQRLPATPAGTAGPRLAMPCAALGAGVLTVPPVPPRAYSQDPTEVGETTSGRRKRQGTRGSYGDSQQRSLQAPGPLLRGDNAWPAAPPHTQ